MIHSIVLPDTGSEVDRARELLASKHGILLDWDGCVAIDNKPHAAGSEFIARHLDRIAVVSNSSSLRPQDMCRTLAECGIHLPRERIILAGHQALLRAAEAKKRALVLGSPAMRAMARDLGIIQVTSRIEQVVLLRDTRFSYARLTQSVNALRDGASLIVANPDLTHPGKGGTIVPETGTLLAALLACVPAEDLHMEIIGKPGPFLFRKACLALGVSVDQAIMIGDNPATDIKGADGLGMESILVKPGSDLRLSALY
ncbi:HAD hydrolase-like protein [Aquidulcibacter sp.]|uniref:HAD-IIA family hydrolase n=1 Tax=Aquidulcibacter sp. TaxID=2052990 RepID=UPI0025C36E3F|nr:HAD hydrolase-like protein [Aquidulcibacter sp.]MCA3694803.1 HAD hydrolase-like protein [Aquidulcibacter sp.]